MASRRLTDDEVMERGQEMARLLGHVKNLQEQKKEFVASIKEQVDEAMDRIQELAEQVREGAETVEAQTDMFNRATGEIDG